MNQQNISFGESIDHFRVPFAMAIYGFLGALYPIALMGYHIFLMARGETTREYLSSHKFLKKDRHRAFTQANWFKNWIVVLCRPRPPSYYQFKKKYVEGDQRLGTTKRSTAETKSDTRPRDDGMEMQNVRPQDQNPGFRGPVNLRDSTPRPVP
jgi:palmitoyltransferase ZDHHC9/14/18